MSTLRRIDIYPIKGLDGQSVARATILPWAGLEHDRRWAIVDRRGDFVSGKRTPLVNRLRSAVDLATLTCSLRVAGTADTHRFDLGSSDGALARWLSDYFGFAVTLVENTAGGFPDDTDSPGPTVISTATLTTVASWFPGLTVDEARRRFRANLEIDGVEPFWEDRLLAAGTDSVRFRIGEAELLGTNPCQRCVVPSRDSLTGDVTTEFARIVSERRRAALPANAPRDRFHHFYRLATNTRTACGTPMALAVGDEVKILGIA